MVLPIVQYMCDELTLQVSTRNIEIANFACYSWVPPPPNKKKIPSPAIPCPPKKIKRKNSPLIVVSKANERKKM